MISSSTLEQYNAGEYFGIARSIKGATGVGMALTLRKGKVYQQFRVQYLLARRLSPMISSKGVNGETRVVAEKWVTSRAAGQRPLDFCLGLNNTSDAGGPAMYVVLHTRGNIGRFSTFEPSK